MTRSFFHFFFLIPAMYDWKFIQNRDQWVVDMITIHRFQYTVYNLTLDLMRSASKDMTFPVLSSILKRETWAFLMILTPFALQTFSKFWNFSKASQIKSHNKYLPVLFTVVNQTWQNILLSPVESAGGSFQTPAINPSLSDSCGDFKWGRISLLSSEERVL